MDYALPEIGEGVYEAELLRWLVKPGDAVRRGQALMEIMTDKATMEVPSPFAGIIGGLRAKAASKVKVGEILLNYEGDAIPNAPAAVQVAESRPQPPPRRNGAGVGVKAAPSVRYLARKLGVDINRVAGSGPQGRVLVEDLGKFVGPSAPAADAAGSPKQDFGTPGTRIKLAGLRRVIAERMVYSKRIIPHYTYVDECDVSEMVRLRDGLRESGAKITYLAFVVKAVVAALKDVPLVNATLDEAAGDIVLHDRYQIGIAIAAPAGLIVPVVRDAEKKDLFQIAREIERLSSDARAGKAKLEDLRGSTFTVTSIGNIGGLFATPVINHPEVGILGIGKVVKRPVYDAAGNLKPADMMYLSLSFDHRVLDGAVGAVFGNAVIKRLRNPVGMLVPEKL